MVLTMGMTATAQVDVGHVSCSVELHTSLSKQSGVPIVWLDSTGIVRLEVCAVGYKHTLGKAKCKRYVMRRIYSQ